MTILLLSILWYISGLIGWPFHAAIYWKMAGEYPILGTAQENWDEGKKIYLIFWILYSMGGPFSLISAIIFWMQEGFPKLKWDY